MLKEGYYITRKIAEKRGANWFFCHTPFVHGQNRQENRHYLQKHENRHYLQKQENRHYLQKQENQKYYFQIFKDHGLVKILKKCAERSQLQHG